MGNSHVFERTSCFTLAVMLLFGWAAFAGEAPVYAGQPSGEYLRDWLVCGPFPAGASRPDAPTTGHLAGFETDYLAGTGGEAGAQPSPGDVVDFDGGSATWTAYESPTDEVSLDDAVSTALEVLAYAYCEIKSDEARPCVMAVGTNDGCRIWLNGRRVSDYPAARGLKLDQDLIPVVLQKGVNRLLFKVEERGNAWGLACRFLPVDAELVKGRVRFFEVVTRVDGTPVFRFRHGAEAARAFVERAALEAVSVFYPEKVLWAKKWNGKAEQVIGVDASRYGEYILRMHAAYKGGIEEAMAYHFTAGERIEYALFEDGASDYVIAIDKGASESERWAANELQHWLQEVGGAELPILELEKQAPEKAIIVGYNKHTARLFDKKAAAPADGDESFTYKNAGPTIAIWGGRDRGSMYGVMSFLEREMGVRWYTPSVTVTPKKERYRFTVLDHSEAAGIRVRNDFYHEAFEPIWAARNRVNGAMNYREQPGGVEGYWRVHTFYPFMPPEEFYDKNPEYYSLIDGERIHERAQLCLTNPHVLDIITERLLKVMREHPEYLIYSVSQNDWRNPCQCEECQAIAEREGTEAGPVVWFVNQVAERVEKEFPDKFVGTLAYQYTRKPPKTIKPRHNVVIRLCSIECCFAHDFKSCPENAEFLDDLQNWAKIAPHLYIWDYVVNFSHYIMPYPNFRVLQSNVQSFRDNHAIGIMEQAAYQSRGGEFAELRAYVLAKLLWDPECNVEEVINDFMYGYYGRSGQFVRQYFDLLHNQLTPDTHIHLGLKPEDILFSDEFVRQAEMIFDRAEGVADSEAIRQRVEMARLPIMYLKCKRQPIAAKRDGTYARFCEIVEREGVTYYAERGAEHRLEFHAEMDGIE